MTSRRLTVLIHGDSGHGKSWLLNTAPGPRLLLDPEGRSEYLADPRDPTGMTPQHIVEWDPRQPVPEQSKDADTVTVVNVQRFEDLQLAYAWLASGQHPFASLLVDSLTECQQRAIDYIANTRPMETQDWGTLLRELEALVRKMRDLRKHPTNPLWVVAFSAGSQEKNGKQRPLLQGQLSLKVAYHFDVVGYIARGIDETTGEEIRNLHIKPFGQIEAKDNTHVLSRHYGSPIRNPNLTDMLYALNPQPVESASA